LFYDPDKKQFKFRAHGTFTSAFFKSLKEATLKTKKSFILKFWFIQNCPLKESRTSQFEEKDP